MILSKLTANIILELSRKPSHYNSASISRTVDGTYSHVTKLLKCLENEKIISRVQKDKRQKIIFLTENGYKIDEHIRNLITLGVVFR